MAWTHNEIREAGDATTKSVKTHMDAAPNDAARLAWLREVLFRACIVGGRYLGRERIVAAVYDLYEALEIQRPLSPLRNFLDDAGLIRLTQRERAIRWWKRNCVGFYAGWGWGFLLAIICQAVVRWI